MRCSLKSGLHLRLSVIDHNPVMEGWPVMIGPVLEGSATMYLNRVDGPQRVMLPDGSTLSRADLPPPDTRRWVASRKAVVVRAVRFGLISEAEALECYALSAEEFALWRRAVEEHGVTALKVTAIQRYRQS